MIKRIITAALACIMAVMCSAVCFAESVEVVKKELTAPQKAVFIGDSIAAGFGLEGYTGDGSDPASCYASILSQKYSKENEGICPTTVINAAVSGDTSAQLREKLMNGELDKYIFGSDVVVISIGGNDILKPALEFLSEDLNIKSEDDLDKLDMSTLASPSTIALLNNRIEVINQNLDGFAQNLSDIISQIRSKTSALIIFQTVYNPLDSNKDYAVVSDMIGSRISRLNSIINEKSKGSDGKDVYLVCDVASAFAGKSSEYTNIDKYDIHPNAEGHKVISELVDKQVKTQKYSYEELVQVDETPKSTVNTSKIYVTLAIFFGGFIALFVAVWVIFRKSQR